MKKIKAVIFDMDGVLIDSENILGEYYITQLKSLGAPASIEDMEALRGANHKTFWSYFVEKYQIPEPDEKHKHEIRLEFIEFLKTRKATPIPGAKELLEYLKKNNIHLAVASSASTVRLTAQLEIIELHKYFAVTVSGQEITHGKPHPEIFLKAAEKLNVNPKDCLVIEDATRGIEAAKKAEMKVVGFAGLSHNKQDLSGADMIIHSFKELTSDIIHSL